MNELEEVTRQDILDFYKLMGWKNIPKECGCAGNSIQGPCAWWLAEEEIHLYMISKEEDVEKRKQVKAYLSLIGKKHCKSLITCYGLRRYI